MKLDDIVDAFLKAIEDRVGRCNLCILAIKPKKSPYYLNRIVVGSFLAMQHNILTVATAGNYGPSIKLVWNVALWILMVGVSSSFKCFRTTMQVVALAFTEIIFFYFSFFWRKFMVIIFMSLFTCLIELISLIILFVFKSIYVLLIILYKLSSCTMCDLIYY